MNVAHAASSEETTHSEGATDAPATETHAEEQAESENPVSAVAGQFGLNAPTFAAQLVNFLIVLVVLWLFLYKPIVRMLEEREEKIEKSVKQADEIEKRLKSIEQEREQVVVDAKKEAQKIIEKAQADAKERGEEMTASAKREVERIITKGKASLQEEKEGMIRDMRKEVVDIAVKASEKILTESVDEAKSQSLAEEVVRKMT